MHDQEQQREFRKLLAEWSKEDENRQCADCTALRPTWASVTLGVYICLRCAGIHRSLGTHVSFVRSINMDDWTPKQMANMKRVGNLKARLYYEAEKPEKIHKPSEQDNVQLLRDYIEKKYVRKTWAPKDVPPPHIRQKKKSESEKDDKQSKAKSPPTKGGVEVENGDNKTKKKKKKQKKERMVRKSKSMIGLTSKDLLADGEPSNDGVQKAGTTTHKKTDKTLDELFGEALSDLRPSAKENNLPVPKLYTPHVFPRSQSQRALNGANANDEAGALLYGDADSGSDCSTEPDSDDDNDSALTIKVTKSKSSIQKRTTTPSPLSAKENKQKAAHMLSLFG